MTAPYRQRAASHRFRSRVRVYGPNAYIAPPKPPRGPAGCSGASEAEPIYKFTITYYVRKTRTAPKGSSWSGGATTRMEVVGEKNTATVYASSRHEARAKIEATLDPLPEGREYRSWQEGVEYDNVFESYLMEEVL